MKRLNGISIRKAALMGVSSLLILVALLISVSVYWLLNTSSGASWLWARLEALESVELNSSRVSGDLDSGFVVRDLEYRLEDLDLNVRHVEVKAGIHWWPLELRVEQLLMQDVGFASRSPGSPVANGDSDVDLRNTIAGFELPVPVDVGDAVLTHISFQQDDDPPHVLAESVSLKARLDDQLLIDNMAVLTRELDAKIQGYLQFEAPFELAVTIDGHFEKTGEKDQVLLEAPFKLEGSGDLDKLELSLLSQKFGLQVNAEILQAVSAPVWNIQAVLGRLQWPQDQPEQGLTLSGLNVSSQGDLEDWSFDVNSELESSQLPKTRLTMSGSGSTSALEVSTATISGTGIDLDFAGTLGWSRQASADLTAGIRQLDLSPWVSDWPAGEKLAGNLELSWSGNSLVIPKSELTIIGDDLTVEIETDIDIQSNRVSGQVNWKNLRWPLGETTARFSSESGQLHISGGIDDWLVEGGVILQVGDYPQGRFDLRGNGDKTSATLLIPAGEILGGRLSGQADADWSGELQWNAAIRTQGVDPEPLLTGWPGRLDSDIKVSARSNPTKLQISLLALEGMLRGAPIFAHGGLELTDTNLAFQSLQVRVDEALLELDGSLERPEGAMVRFSGNLPPALLQGARGKLEFEGWYSDHAGRPSLGLNLQGRDISWNELKVSNLAINTSGKNAGPGLPGLQLDAAGMVWSDVAIDELSLALNPVGKSYELKTNVVSEDVVLNGLMSLVNEDPNKSFSGPWRGELSELELAVGPAYLFELSRPADFAWSAGSALLGPLCLSEKMQSSLCLDLDYRSNGDWSLVADATAIPLNYLRDYLELDLNFEQLLEGRLEWHQPRGQAPTGGADFRITAGDVLDLLDNEKLTETRPGLFSFKLQNGNLESGVIDLDFPGTGFIDVGFDVLDIMVGGARKIEGRAIAQLDHFKLAGQLALPGVDAVDGQFVSNIQLGGSLADPAFDGEFSFSNGFIDYAPLGLKLEDIEFEGRVKQRDFGEFQGQFRAGEGIGSLKGNFLFKDIETAELEIDLSGEQLLLVNTEMLKILTETDLKLAVSPGRLDIDGHIMVPSASLTPRNLLLGEVRDSDDLVIESPGAKTQTGPVEAPAKRQVHGQLEVSLGDDVSVTLPGIETSITGSALFNWSGEPVPMAEGGYTLQGKVDVYGPRLTISNGSINFPSVPANNPLLNIRAGRDIFGNTQIRRAGVRVIGTLKRPVVEAYTVPVTNEDRAWTLLITGSDFDQGQGINGFDVGTYIAPRLYVSYGISLFEDENVISVRYDLTDRFGVKATSGQRETGLDVSYTIDK